ncbi:DUF4097 family beta strand repeat-containing protein [Macrococcus lamae]|uniref:DUF4097 domain-containing protein n=1 Tax=Macrococcus lamae TaxID=198484 RepID=A0A4V3BF28_9STAP|nr:DUF4097 family beta strand repeat-containing protein [Macrococcus lamae]TDM05315.1 hypothetical protein ERX29_10115 [Macrococcus lamae]
MFFTRSQAVVNHTGTYHHEETLDKTFNNIDINMALGDVEIKENNDSSTRIEIQHAKSEKTFQYKVEDQTLKVHNDNKLHKFNFNFGMSDDNEGKLIIYLPKKTYDKLDISSDVAQIDIQSINVKSADLNVDVGEINVEELKTETIDFSVDTGEINLKGLEKATTINGTVNIGEANFIYVERPDNVTFNIDTDIGDVNMNGIAEDNGVIGKGTAKVNVKVDTGDVEVDVK